MDFFASQDLARRKTKWLVFYFVLAVVAMIVGIYLVVVLALKFNSSVSEMPQPDINWAVIDIPVLLIVSLSVLTVVGGGTAYKVAELSGGGNTVASQLGGRRLQPNSTDPMERRILNVVEEMALAAGTPVPPVFVLDAEPGINAFAAGYTVDDAVIGVNRGTIEQLNRDELQGVIAHEFSHILNGDMRMSIRLIGILHGIQLLALIGYFILRASHFRGSSRDNKGLPVILIVAVALLVFGSIGLFFARVIKASVSRQREYLADASAVQFTRNPEGIGGALKMIGASVVGSQVTAPQAEVASHMFFANMFRQQLFGWLSTHPPLERRIKAIDPRFSGDFKEYLRNRKTGTILAEKKPRKSTKAKSQSLKPPLITPGGFGGIFTPGEAGSRFPIDPVMVIAAIGLPTDEDAEYSQALVESLPESIAQAARDAYSARCLAFAIVINAGGDQAQERQLEIIRQHEGAGTEQATRELLIEVAKLPAQFRLPVFEIMQGTLVGISANQYATFRKAIEDLVVADSKVSLFEFFLQHHLIVHLDRHFGHKTVAPMKFNSIYALQSEIMIVIGVLVKAGHQDENEAAGAYAAAMNVLKQPWGSAKQLQSLKFTNNTLAESLDRIAAASPSIKKQVLLAAAQAIIHDGKVTVEEAELFRAISESLDCPVPPVVAGQLKGET